MNCYSYGGIRCGHLNGECNQGPLMPPDEAWKEEAKRLEAELECDED